MFVDLRGLAEGAVVEADLCIIGGGAAGIALACAFAGRDLRVCLVESGGFEPEDATQDLYRGESVGVPGFELNQSRLRWFGGSTNHWNGWCASYGPADFEARPWIPHSGWPLTAADLEPSYRRAAEWLGLGEFPFDPGDDDAAPGRVTALDPDRLKLSSWRMDVPPARLGTAFRAELDGAPNVTALLHANAVKLARSPDRTELSHVELATLEGRPARVRARIFVLACGGLENPRLLLASNDVEPAGLGNRHDQVGRYYADHFQMLLGEVHEAGDALTPLRRQGGSEGSAPRLAGIRLSDRLQREHSVANSVAYLGNVGKNDPPEFWNEGQGSEAAGPVDRAAGMLKKLMTSLSLESGPAGPRAPGTPRGGANMLRSYGNPLPDPESRVRLSGVKDALGLPRLELDWRLGDSDRRGLTVLAETVGLELARLGAGRLRLAPWLREGSADPSLWKAKLRAANHPSGTTRMTADPRNGVTDADARVHGIGNLYIAGSSLFPVAGWGNPTLTLLALTYRLADHLGRELGVAPVPAHG